MLAAGARKMTFTALATSGAHHMVSVNEEYDVASAEHGTVNGGHDVASAEHGAVNGDTA